MGRLREGVGWGRGGAEGVHTLRCMKGCIVIEGLKHSCKHSATNFAENRFSLTKTTQLGAGGGVR